MISKHNFRSSGFKLSLNHHSDMPIIDQKGIVISPGSMVEIAVSPTLINITEKAVNRFKPEERNCYMSQEIELEHFPTNYGYRYQVSIPHRQ